MTTLKQRAVCCKESKVKDDVSLESVVRSDSRNYKENIDLFNY